MLIFRDIYQKLVFWGDHESKPASASWPFLGVLGHLKKLSTVKTTTSTTFAQSRGSLQPPSVSCHRQIHLLARCIGAF